MRKLLLFAALFSLSMLALTDGPDGDVFGTGYFEISVTEDLNHANPPPAPADTYSEMQFLLADGWDFGDRIGYECAWIEYFQGQDERFEAHFEVVANYPFDLKIQDRYGLEDDGNRAIAALCGSGTFGIVGNVTHDGSDHFPHLIHPGDGITIYDNGEQITSIPLAHDPCDKAYWVPGDEPGEAWLWWDEDGPTGSHGEGMNDLNCGGGPGEPVAVVRLNIKNADPTIGYCTHSAHEDMCYNVEPPPTPVTLGSGRSVLTCPNGATPVVESTEPLVVDCG